MAARGEFSSRLGFILAASGSAVGLGNIWGFPTRVAENGGAAFIIIYLLLAFCLAYPVLMAEFVIGRAKQANMVKALQQISKNHFGTAVGAFGCLTVVLILAFYAIVAGWMLAFFVSSVVDIFQSEVVWFTSDSQSRNLVFTSVFLALTCAVVVGGVSQGIERWSIRLMPTLFVTIILLIIYVSTLEGALEGWKVFLVPNFSSALSPDLMIDALGQAFFSMSLGVGTMLVYASYVSKRANLPQMGAYVALLDIGVAILAGMLIIPSMYVAFANGIDIFSTDGALISGPTLIFQVLPSLFTSMGAVGVFVSALFFMLMVVAALTSSISMLEAPVAYFVDSHKISRKTATISVTLGILMISGIIIFNFGLLFEFVIALTTKYSQPLLGLIICLFTGFLWRRNEILNEIKQGFDKAEHSLFWKIWPWYIKFVCPLVIGLLFYRTVIA